MNTYEDGSRGGIVSGGDYKKGLGMYCLGVWVQGLGLRVGLRTRASAEVLGLLDPNIPNAETLSVEIFTQMLAGARLCIVNGYFKLP